MNINQEIFETFESSFKNTTLNSTSSQLRKLGLPVKEKRITDAEEAGTKVRYIGMNDAFNVFELPSGVVISSRILKEVWVGKERRSTEILANTYERGLIKTFDEKVRDDTKWGNLNLVSNENRWESRYAYAAGDVKNF